MCRRAGGTEEAAAREEGEQGGGGVHYIRLLKGVGLCCAICRRLALNVPRRVFAVTRSDVWSWAVYFRKRKKTKEEELSS